MMMVDITERRRRKRTSAWSLNLLLPDSVTTLSLLPDIEVLQIVIRFAKSRKNSELNN